MKIKILVAFIATATIIFLSCNWFRSKNKEISNPLMGEWKLDSVRFSKDSSSAYFGITAVMHDSAGADVSFTKDSIFTRSNDHVDTVGYSFDEKEKQLNIKDSSNQSLRFVKLNDSLITLTTDDSTVVLFLQKK
jgi:hypothetical protein